MLTTSPCAIGKIIASLSDSTRMCIVHAEITRSFLCSLIQGGMSRQQPTRAVTNKRKREIVSFTTSIRRSIVTLKMRTVRLEKRWEELLRLRKFRECRMWITKRASLVLQQQVLDRMGSVEHPISRRPKWVINWPDLCYSWKRLSVAEQSECRKRFIEAVEEARTENNTSVAREGRAARRDDSNITLELVRATLLRAHNVLTSGRPVRLGCFVLPRSTLPLADDHGHLSGRAFPITCKDIKLGQRLLDTFCWARCTQPPATPLPMRTHPTYGTVLSKVPVLPVFELLEDCQYSMFVPSRNVRVAASSLSMSSPILGTANLANADPTVAPVTLDVHRMECIERCLNGLFVRHATRNTQIRHPYGFHQIAISNHFPKGVDRLPSASSDPSSTQTSDSSASEQRLCRTIHRFSKMEMSNTIRWPSTRLTCLAGDTWCTSLVELLPSDLMEADGRRVYDVQHLLIRVMWQETELYYKLLDMAMLCLPRELWALMAEYAFPVCLDQNPDLPAPTFAGLHPPLFAPPRCMSSFP